MIANETILHNDQMRQKSTTIGHRTAFNTLVKYEKELKDEQVTKFYLEN